MKENQDRLDIFFKLMQKKDRQDLSRGHPSENIYNMLCNMYYYHDAFFFMYENIPANLRPDWNKDVHFRSIFMSALNKTEDDFFNHYFFQGLNDYCSVEDIRAYSLDRPNNQKLKEFSMELDNPVKIDKIMKALLTFYHSDLDRFDTLWVKSESKLKGLKKINKEKSHALQSVTILFEAIRKKEGFEKANEMAQSIDLNLISVASITKRSIIPLYDYGKEKTRKFIEFFHEYQQTIKDLTQNASELNHMGQKHQLDIFSRAFHIYNIAEAIDDMKNEPDIVLYLWDLIEKKVEFIIANEAYSMSQNWEKYGVNHGSSLMKKIECMIKDDNPKFYSFIDSINKTKDKHADYAELIGKNMKLVSYLRMEKLLDKNVPYDEAQDNNMDSKNKLKI
jgi:hypothetical protein